LPWLGAYRWQLQADITVPGSVQPTIHDSTHSVFSAQIMLQTEALSVPSATTAQTLDATAHNTTVAAYPVRNTTHLTAALCGMHMYKANPLYLATGVFTAGSGNGGYIDMGTLPPGNR
jgi:hypothetical protein